MLTVSVLIPAYNEEQTILTLLKQVNAVKAKQVKLQIIVVDDGSRDKTVEILEANPDLYQNLVKMPMNGGKGAAVQAGLRVATGDYVLFQDADLEYDPAEYVRLFEAARKFDADIVMGSRFIAPQLIRVTYFWHKVGNKLISLFFNILNNTAFTDIYSCYLMYRRSLVDPDNLKTFGWEQQAEILSIAVQNGKVFYEVPISYHGRTYDDGKKIRAHHALGVLWTSFKMRFFN